MVKHEFKKHSQWGKASPCSSLKLLSEGGRPGVLGSRERGRERSSAPKKSCADALSWVHQQAKAKPRTFFRTSRLTSALSLEKKNENARDQVFNNFSPGENKESRRKDDSRWVSQQPAWRAAAPRPPPGLQTWTLPFRVTATFFWERYPQRPCHNLPQTLILSKMQSPVGRWLWPPPTSPLGPILQRSPRSSQRVAEERWEKVRVNLILGFCACCLWLLLPASALSRNFSWAPPSLLIPRPKCPALLTLSTVISNIPYQLKSKTSPATSIAEVQWPTLRQ